MQLQILRFYRIGPQVKYVRVLTTSLGKNQEFQFLEKFNHFSYLGIAHFKWDQNQIEKNIQLLKCFFKYPWKNIWLKHFIFVSTKIQMS
jgi:hypothetical protein